MERDKKSNKKVIIALIMILTISIVSISFAFFTPFIKNGSIFSTSGKASGGSCDIALTDVTSAITLSNVCE